MLPGKGLTMYLDRKPPPWGAAPQGPCQVGPGPYLDRPPGASDVGEGEVGDLDVALRVDEDVLRLHTKRVGLELGLLNVTAMCHVLSTAP